MRSIAAIALLGIASLAQAQVSEVIEVRVASVDVVVLDKSGKPILGLTKDDFQLFENGKQQPLTNFYEMRSEPVATAAAPGAAAPAPQSEAPAEARKRSIVVFVDDTTIAPFARNKAVDSIQRSLSTLIRDGDDAMIVNWSRVLEVVQPFTTDRMALDSAVAKLRKRVADAPSVNAEKSRVIGYAQEAINFANQARGRYTIAQAYSDSMATWRTYAESLRVSQLQLIKAVSQMFSTLSGNDRKKVFLFLGGELQERAGVDVLQQIDAMFQLQNQRVSTIPPMIQTSDVTLSTQLRELAHAASADGITMYMIDAGDRRIDEMPGGGPRDPTVDFLSDMNSMMSMGLLASTTGGALVSGTRNFDGALKDLSRDLDSYYSLGYRPPDGPKERRIVVKVNRPGAQVRSRAIYAIKTPEEQTNDSVVANVFHDGLKSDFRISVAMGKPEPAERNTFKVMITVTFPSDLTYLPEGDQVVGQYDVYFVTASPQGAISPVARQTKTVSFPAAIQAEVVKKPFTHSAMMIVRGGTQSVSVAVVDRRGARVGYGRTTFTAE